MNRFKNDERGVVAIVVTVIVLIVISLTTLGFAGLARREQRQALDQQLSTIAYYASESGVNDAVQAIKNKSNPYRDDKDTCDDPGDAFKSHVANKPNEMQFSTFLVGELGGIGSGTSEYSCLLIDQNPDDLKTDSVDDVPWRIPINPSGSRPLRKLIISWQDTTGGITFAGPSADTFPAPNGWTGGGSTTGLLRVDLTNMSDPQSYNSLSDNSLTAFLYPNRGGGAGLMGRVRYDTSHGYGSRGEIVTGRCNTGNNSGRHPYYCNVEITNLPDSSTGHRQAFFLRVSSIYRASKVIVYGEDNSNNLVPLVGAQAIVDSTGKANDVLHRMVVRVDLTDSDYTFPNSAVDSVKTICKQLYTVKGETLSANTNNIDECKP